MAQLNRFVSDVMPCVSMRLCVALLLAMVMANSGCGGGSKDDFNKPLFVPKASGTSTASAAEESPFVKATDAKPTGDPAVVTTADAKPMTDAGKAAESAPTETPQVPPAQVKDSSKDTTASKTVAASPTAKTNNPTATNKPALDPLTAEEREWLSIKRRQASSFDGEFVLTATDSRQLSLHSIRQRVLDREFFGRHETISALALGPHRQWIVGATETGSLRLWTATKTLTGLDRFARDAHQAAEAARAGEDSGQQAVRSIAVHPHGEWFVTGGEDGSLQVWTVQVADAVAAMKTQKLAAHDGVVTALAVSADGRWLASGGQDRKVQLWDVASWTASRTWTDPKAVISDVSLSANGQVVAASSFDKLAYWWPVAAPTTQTTDQAASVEKTGEKPTPKTPQPPKPTNRFEHPDLVLAVSVSADGTQVLTGCKDKLVRVWDVATGKTVERQEPAKDAVVEVRFVSDDKRTLTRDRSGMIRNRLRIAVTSDEEEDARQAAQSATSNWQFITPAELLTIRDSTDIKPQVPFNDRLNHLASTLRTAASHIERDAARDAYFDPPVTDTTDEKEKGEHKPAPWKPAANTQERSERPQLIGSLTTHFQFAVSPNESARTASRKLDLSLSADGELLTAVEQAPSETTANVRLDSAKPKSGVWIWDVASQAPLRHWDDLQIAPAVLQFIDARSQFVSPTSAMALSLSTGQAIDLSKSPETNRIQLLVNSPDGQRLAVGYVGSKQTTSKILRLLDATTLEEVQSLEAFEAVCTSLVFTPDGSSLLVAIRERQQHRLLMFDANTFELQTTLEEHPHTQPWLQANEREANVDRGITSLVCSSDGRGLISHGSYASGDFRLSLWQRRGPKWTRETAGSANAKQPIVDESRQPTPLWFVGGKTNQMAAITAKGLGIWDTSNGRTLRSIELRDGQHERGPYAWSGDGQWLVQGDNIGNVAVWNLRTDKEPGFFTAQRSPIKALALSHSGQVLATLGEENQLHLWNLASWTPKNRVPTKSKTIAKPVSSD